MGPLVWGLRPHTLRPQIGVSHNNTLNLLGLVQGVGVGVGGGKGGVRQFVIEEQKGRETQMLLEVWMVIILKFVHKTSFDTLY